MELSSSHSSDSLGTSGERAFRLTGANEREDMFVSITEDTSVTSVCDELKKLYVSCCGMPHEDRSRNPGRGTCPNASKTYNVACVHSHAGIPVLQAYEMATRLGMRLTAKRLWDEFEFLSQQLDLVDSEGSVLYSISTDLIAADSDRADSALRRLAHVNMDTSVSNEDNKAVQGEIRSTQARLGQEMLDIRDQFLGLLEPFCG